MLAWEYCKLKTSELVPYPQIDKPLDTDARLKTAEPVFRAGFHPEGGQLERGEYVCAIVQQTCRINHHLYILVHI